MAQWSEVWSDPKVAKRDKKAVIMKRANTPAVTGEEESRWEISSQAKGRRA